MENVIKKIRTEKGLSQNELARLCDVGLSTIFQLEHCNRKEIHHDVLKTLEEIGYDPAEIKESYDYQRQQQREEMIQKLA